VAKARGHGPKRIFVDTNVLLRYLLDDVPEQADAVEEILKRAAAGEFVLVLNTMVIAEIIWTCESYYGLPKGDIRDKVLAILNTPGLEVEDRDLIAEAVWIYAERNIDFADAYNGCWLKRNGLAAVYTFDRGHFRRMEGVRVLTPGKDG